MDTAQYNIALDRSIEKHGVGIMDTLMDRCVTYIGGGNGRAGAMEVLVARGCKVYKDHMYWASTFGNLDAVKFVYNYFRDMPELEQKAHERLSGGNDDGGGIFEWTVNGVTAFDSAIKMGQLDVVKYILHQHGGIPIMDSSVYSFDLANEHGYYEMGAFLCETERRIIRDDEDDNEEDFNEGFWPIFYLDSDPVSFKPFDAEFFKFVITNKILGVDEVSDLGNTMLHIACERRDKPLLDFFLEAGADIGIKNSKDQTPLEVAKETMSELSGDFVEALERVTGDRAWGRRGEMCMIRSRAESLAENLVVCKHVDKKLCGEVDGMASFMEGVPDGVFRNIVEYL